ncbi:DNA polymerase III subunit epsilon [Microbacterium sp. MEC084]|uniref:3'-5' exonuclease n=1 Tax=unclassified Microbacterium TaxID=2609290 RepID=UPI0006FF1FB0|nr:MULTISPECIES: 3'-5' exonuclease [unclassified Microbacterium]KQZ04999.1 DNA polymerase III subunit epsilon [Microbacterium sp. Root53]MCD1267640.1 DNA polymerase III subunit epsilon [Microbacterium sp. MEC084]
MALDFTAIDFETANGSRASACQVGLAKVRDGRVVEKTGWLIRPPAGHDLFQEWNTRIHGITAADVEDALGWDEQIEDLIGFAGDDVLVAHNASFDMGVLRAACEVTSYELPAYRYLCTLAVARKAYQLPSYRLPVAAEAAGFTGFAHHDAIADALACAHILIDAARRSGADDVDGLAEALGVRTAQIAPAVVAAA